MRGTEIPAITDVKSLDAGNSHICALLNSGGIKCWGSGKNGRLGNYNSSTFETPQNVYGVSTATSIGLGENHSCAVLDNNYVACWEREMQVSSETMQLQAIAFRLWLELVSLRQIKLESLIK